MKRILNCFLSLLKNYSAFIVISEAIFWSPALILFILHKPALAGAYIAFWAMPVTPAIPLQIGLAVLLQRLWRFIACRSRK